MDGYSTHVGVVGLTTLPENAGCFERTEDVLPITADDALEEVLSRDQLNLMRSRIIDLLRSLEPNREGSESIASTIARFTHQGLIPRATQPWFRTVTEMRNEAEYESNWVITPAGSQAVLAAWNAIKE